MHVMIAHECVLPVSLYGGTERVLWALGKELRERGCKVTYLLQQGSTCDFAEVFFLDGSQKVAHLIPDDVDLVHFNFHPKDLRELNKPYVVNVQGNSNNKEALDINSIFVSSNHAARYGSSSFIHNGMDWSSYSKPDLSRKRTYFHFLAKAAWRVKNIKGSIDTIKKTKTEKLHVLGGVRYNFKMGIRLTFSPKVTFHGMVGGRKKDELINGSKGLLFPVRWHEPFGIALIESLFYGCPVFGTTYGSLHELIGSDVGYLSNSSDELAEQLLLADTYSKQKCHDYARSIFNSKIMCSKYIEKYEKVLSGQTLNDVEPRLVEVQKEAFLPWD